MVRIYLGDNRFLNNIFVGGDIEELGEKFPGIGYGTSKFDGSPTSMEEYVDQFVALNEFDIRNTVNSPVQINNNSYFAGSKPFCDDVNKTESELNPNITFTEEDGCFYMELELDDKIFELKPDIIKSYELPVPLYGEAPFEDADGYEIVIDKDYLGNERGSAPTVGPFEGLKPGKNKILVWRRNK